MIVLVQFHHKHLLTAQSAQIDSILLSRDAYFYSTQSSKILQTLSRKLSF